MYFYVDIFDILLVCFHCLLLHLANSIFEFWYYAYSHTLFGHNDEENIPKFCAKNHNHIVVLHIKFCPFLPVRCIYFICLLFYLNIILCLAILMKLLSSQCVTTIIYWATNINLMIWGYNAMVDDSVVQTNDFFD